MSTNQPIASGDDELAQCQALVRTDPDTAAERLRRLIGREPFCAAAYRLLARVLEQRSGSAQTGAAVVSASIRGPDLLFADAANALRANDLDTVERLLKRRLSERPEDANALRMLAEVAARRQSGSDAIELLRLALEIAPDFDILLLDLGNQLQRQKAFPEALQVLDEYLAGNPGDRRAGKMKATTLTALARFEEAARVYEELLAGDPQDAEAWTSLGFVLKTLGRGEETVEAFRRAAAASPTLGAAWWGLSDLKTVRFDDEDVDRMQEALRDRALTESDRIYLHFALGKAFEDRKHAAEAFDHYATGNRLRRETVEYDGGKLSRYIDKAIARLDRQFFDERRGCGDPSGDPIFILGMTRAGSTLIEQMLASHPQVEGTMELPEVPMIASELYEELDDYARELVELPPEKFEDLGRRYLDLTRKYRKTDRPLFIDKFPNNWMHVPLIQLMLPNARIIDARRHPLACCFSNFKQYYPRGQMFSYGLAELGRYYSDYVRLMAHVDEALPGRVHRVIHEQLVEDTEAELRRLLDHLGLPFDEACLRFYESKRAVPTASAEQVRRPINREGMGKWKMFEPWLDPLKDALGPVLDLYPNVPDFRSEG